MKRVLIVAPAACCALVACSAGTTRHASAPPATTVAPARPPAVAWPSLHNPLLADANHAVKDPAIVDANGVWHALFSYVDRAGHWRIGVASSPTMQRWSTISVMPHDPTTEGEASPDVVRAPDGHFVVTYQSFVHDRASGLAKLYYRTTDNFTTFSPPHPLAVETHMAPNDRLIDAALAWTPAGLLLGYKFGADTQAFEIARSTTGTLAGPWQLVGRPNIRLYGDTIENYQFFARNGAWHLLATSNVADKPYLFDLVGDATSPQAWLQWSAGRELQIPQERWNTGSGATGATYEHANCAYIVDSAPVDGYFYVVYSDSPNKTTFGGEGPAVLALARSTDLTHWATP